MAEDQFTIIVENDITQWHDQTGVTYHYPRRYRRFLTPGTRLIHYKGRMLDPGYAASRLSPHPHYFATSIAGDSVDDPASEKGDLNLEILNFRMFDAAVHYKDDVGEYREEIPPTRVANFWRDGVRPSPHAAFLAILAAAGLTEAPATSPTVVDDLTSVIIEGGKRRVYTTTYERSPENRAKAIDIHGTTCFACETSPGQTYGEVAKGYIHIHHRRPLHITGETVVDPAVDLVPLCPTCHAIVHLGGKLRTVNQVRGLLGKGPIALGD